MPLSKLNDQQREASLAPSGYNLIIASAGTGKTSTIVGRISYLLESGILPNEILLLTFTNKAAQEMLKRLELRFDSRIVKQIEAGTFHAVAYRYLKNKNSIILNSQESLKCFLKASMIKGYLRIFPKLHLMGQITYMILFLCFKMRPQAMIF